MEILSNEEDLWWHLESPQNFAKYINDQEFNELCEMQTNTKLNDL